MDLLKRLNGVIDYLEEYLLDDEKLSAPLIARQAMMPAAQFFRLFPYIAGVSVYEYIRRRRLTLAAQELMSTDCKVIDTALKYGYESPDAFGRAFLAQHGAPPSAARKTGVTVAAFPKLRFTITIKGDVSVNYQIKEKPGFTVMGKKLTVTHQEDGNNGVSEFWSESMPQEWYAKLCSLCRTELGVMGVCGNMRGNEFDYYIAIEQTADLQAEGDGFDTLDVPASTWACFEAIGPMPHAIQDVWKYVLSEWLPSSGYKHAGTPDMEIYSPGNSAAADYRSYVWIPVVKE